MAHIFGEINEPESRAFWDDEELDASQFQYSLRWIGEKAIPSAINTLLIVEGSVASEFTKSCTVGDSKEICVIEHGRLKPSLIYKINEDLYTLIVSPDLDARHATEFTMTMNGFLLKSDKIIAITCQHVSSYKTDSTPVLPSFLKSLRTESAKFLPDDNVERIKQPNIVSGIVAAVMSYAEVFGLSAISYVLYVEEFLLDSETAVPLKKLFNQIPGSLLHEPVFKQNSFSSRGNLYM